jgi:hypothetical protein
VPELLKEALNFPLDLGPLRGSMWRDKEDLRLSPLVFCRNSDASQTFSLTNRQRSYYKRFHEYGLEIAIIPWWKDSTRKENLE